MAARPVFTLLGAAGLAFAGWLGSADRAEALLQMQLEVLDGGGNTVVAPLTIVDNDSNDGAATAEVISLDLGSLISAEFGGTVQVALSNQAAGTIPATVLLTGSFDYTGNDGVRQILLSLRQTDFFAPDVSSGDVTLPVTAGIQLIGDTTGLTDATGTAIIDFTNSATFGSGATVSTVFIDNTNAFADSVSNDQVFGGGSVPYAIEFASEFNFNGRPVLTVNNAGAIVGIVSEPATLALLGFGLLGIGFAIRQRHGDALAAI